MAKSKIIILDDNMSMRAITPMMATLALIQNNISMSDSQYDTNTFKSDLLLKRYIFTIDIYSSKDIDMEKLHRLELSQMCTEPLNVYTEEISNTVGSKIVQNNL